MIIGHRIHGTEEAKVVFVWGVVAVPAHHIVGGPVLLVVEEPTEKLSNLIELDS